MQVLGGDEERARSRISYKKKLEEMKAKRGGGGGGAVKSVKKKVEPPEAVNTPPAVTNPGNSQVAPAAPKPNVAANQANPVRPPPPPGLIPMDMSKPGAIPLPPKMMS